MPFEAMQAGQLYRQPEVAQVQKAATGAIGAIEGVGEEAVAEVPGLSRAARDMVRRARAVGIDPSDIGPLAKRVREGTLSERGLSMSLKQLRQQLPDTAKMAAAVRGVGEDLPVDIRAAVSKAVRAGDITLQQAKRMLKAGVGGLAAVGGLEALRGQQQQPTPTGQPSALQRFESAWQPGTAQAEEPPVAPGAGAPAAAPTPPADLPAFPSAPARAPAAAPAGQPQQATPVMQGYTVDLSTGKAVVRMAPPKIPEQAMTQVIALRVGMKGVDSALDLWDKKIAPKEKQFEGTLAQTPVAALRGMMQYTAYSKSRFTEPVGLQVDPDIANLYAHIGPIMGQQLKGLVGGRIGQYMLDGPLAKHIPNGENDSIRVIHEKLVQLKPIMEDTYNEIQKMRGMGMSEDQQLSQLITENGGTPYVDSSGRVVGYSTGAEEE
jgi:hypothetical protein